MKGKKLMSMALCLGLLTGCGNSVSTAENRAAHSSSSSSVSSGLQETDENTADQIKSQETEGVPQTEADMFTDRDYETHYDETSCVLIELRGNTAAASSDSVEISGGTVTITQEAVYVISGTLDDGMILVNAPDSAKVHLVLKGAVINSSSSAPIYVSEADKVFVTLADGTENSLSNGGTFTVMDEENMDAVIYSKQDLTLNGSGSLTVTSPAGHGIASNDDLVITGGSYKITAAAHGLNANDSIRIAGETQLTVEAGKDGIHAENNHDTSLGFVYIADGAMEIKAEGDGISAGAYMQIETGEFQITAGGGCENGSKESPDSWGDFRGARSEGKSRNSKTSPEPAAQTALETEGDDGSTDSSTSMKGIKSTGNMVINNGSFSIDSADDGVHSNGSIAVNGGVFKIASGDDGFHADETLTVGEGTIEITESYEGLEDLDLSIQGGDITLVSSDDGLNAAGGVDSSGITGGRDGGFRGGAGGERGGTSASSDGSIEISGGTLRITASGDGIDANGSVLISGGYTIVSGPAQGDTATLDYDTTAEITGGIFVGTGASGMAQTFSDSEQGVIMVNTGSQTGGTAVTIADQEGNEIFAWTPQLDFTTVIFSSPDVTSGQAYTLTAGTVSVYTEAK